MFSFISKTFEKKFNGTWKDHIYSSEQCVNPNGFLDCFSLSRFLATFCWFYNLRLSSLDFELNFG